MEHQQQQRPSPEPLTSIKLRGQTKKRLAARLLQIHLRGRPASVPTTTTTNTTTAEYKPVRVVCVADTHNTQPVLPAGDVLIHAGDLTDRGSFAEVQAGLAWLAAQPHQHKILVAGNHDVLLDDAFLEKHPKRRYGQSATETKRDLDWGDATYFQDRHVSIRVGARSLTIYGAPWTPAYGVSAFQYRPDCPTHWSQRLRAFSPAQPPDILVTHGPPKLHRDQRDFYRACLLGGAGGAPAAPAVCLWLHSCGVRTGRRRGRRRALAARCRRDRLGRLGRRGVDAHARRVGQDHSHASSTAANLGHSPRRESDDIRQRRRCWRARQQAAKSADRGGDMMGGRDVACAERVRYSVDVKEDVTRHDVYWVWPSDRYLELASG
ncbi:uncharacterized protein SPSK_06407 [Sporothrix schenckii 1099-18]|uniref:Calcineurin-like phosphoesterase domain-containing protein n=1 Tax=Sporothrix schenckii 1099-18 TaxID=1397361 RepID=A0A0F2MIY2_SPOSC|nr:uncharacterized protein SPSK_06407 [Sporothrix schenckii 1099-18]KJR89658.1 hypothetical protein SPSK_06407 [Sporothrix schenckii 1099-18]